MCILVLVVTESVDWVPASTVSILDTTTAHISYLVDCVLHNCEVNYDYYHQ